MQQITLPGGTIEYVVAEPALASAAAPVVFVHGFLVDCTLWAGVAEELARQGVTSYAPTWPLGSHRIAMNSGTDLTPRGVARLVIAFLDALDLRDVTLVGNDSGGAITQFVCDIDPSRVGRVVLTNCDAFTNFPPAPFAQLFALARIPGAARAMVAPMRARVMRHGPLGFGLLTETKLDPVMTRRWIEPVLHNVGVRRDVRTFARGVDPQDLNRASLRLGHFHGPALLCWAPADRFFTIEHARRLRDTFANASLVEIPHAKTFVSLDQPVRVAREIAAFVSATNAADTTVPEGAPTMTG